MTDTGSEIERVAGVYLSLHLTSPSIDPIAAKPQGLSDLTFSPQAVDYIQIRSTRRLYGICPPFYPISL